MTTIGNIMHEVGNIFIPPYVGRGSKAPCAHCGALGTKLYKVGEIKESGQPVAVVCCNQMCAAVFLYDLAKERGLSYGQPTIPEPI